MRSRHLTLKVFSLIVIDGICNIVAQVLMKKGLIEIGLSKNTISPILWFGIIMYALNFFIWIVILYKVDLSIAMPAGSISYIFIPIIAIFFLHEHVGIARWIGIMLIVSGIHFVSRSGRPEAPREDKTDG